MQIIIGNSIGVNRTSTLGGGPFEYTAIDNNFSMEFDGTNYMDLGDNPPIFTNFSLSFWYKQNGAAGSFEAVVGRDTIDGGILTSIVFNSGLLSFKNRPGSWTPLTTTIASNTEFKHYLITYNSSTNELKGYCNGSLEVTTTPVFSGATGNEHSFNRIGRYGTVYYLDGLLDELSVWSTVLSEPTIEAIYNTTNDNPGKAADLSETPEGAPVAWYRFE